MAPKDSKAGNAAAGLKTGNIKVKGENFYRDGKKAKRVSLLSGRSSKAIRDKNGKITQAAEFQSWDVVPGRVQPDRRWFGNTRTISQTALDHFRTSLAAKVDDPYSVVLKKNKLPMSLLTDAVTGATKPDLTTTEPFRDTFGAKAQRKRPRLDVGSIAELASTSARTLDMPTPAVDGAAVAATELDPEQSRAPEDVAAEVAAGLLNNVPKDYILSAGTSKRIWSELYKVIDSSDVLLHVLDARDPLGTRCDSVEKYLAKEKRGKKVIYILNKVDLVPGWVAARWVKILSKTHPTIAFHASINNSFGKGSLIQLLRQFSTLFSDKKQISVGFIGYPNVGKSSIINTLKKKAVCKAAPIPGETKVWQYITLMRRIYLIDCPGIVPPSSRETESQKVLKGVVRVEHLSSPQDHIDTLMKNVRKVYLEKTYGVTGWDTTEEFLAKLAVKMGKLHRGGEADYRTVATMVLNDWIRGKIPYFVKPPELEGGEARSVRLGATGKDSLDADGNKVRSIPGVTQPLKQIVRALEFEDEDDAVVDAEDDDDEVEEEWSGIADDAEDEEDEDDFDVEDIEDDEEEGDESVDPEATLKWDELFDQAVGEAAEAEDVEEEDASEANSNDDDDSVDILVHAGQKTLAASRKRKADADEDVESEEEQPSTKEARMKTSKKKASNFYSTANVKNRNRERKAPKNNERGKKQAKAKAKGTAR